MPIAGTKLNVLHMTTDAFTKLNNKKRLVFRLYLNQDDKMTMAFWQGKNTKYDDNDPVNILDVSGPSDFAWQKGMYLGDQKIGSKKIEEIQKEIKKNKTAHYVLFIPTTDTALPAQIVFTINLSTTTDSHDFTPISVTNPSPPRNSGKRD